MAGLATAILVVLATTPGWAGQADTDEKNVIVVTATLPQLKAAVDKCVAGGCTPREDVIASVRYAEGQFRKGDYGSSRKTIAAAVSRNKGAASADPIAISQLYEAQATIAAHYGDRDEVIAAEGASARILRAEMPFSTMSFNAEMRLIDFAAQTNALDAVGRYGRLADRAFSAGKPVLAMAAQLRQAWVLSRRREGGRARRILASIAASDDAKAASVRLAARILLAHIARESGDRSATDALLADLVKNPVGAEPVLIWSPPMPRPDSAGQGEDIAVQGGFGTAGSTNLLWIDVGYWIKPDGGVDSVEILRGSRSTHWAAPIVKMVALRRYAPMKSDEGQEGQYRVERYTLTADFDTPTGSLVRRRGRNPRFEQLDLTEKIPAG